LRHGVNGGVKTGHAAAQKSAESLAVESRRAQLNVRSTLEEKVLPENLIADETAASSAVEKASTWLNQLWPVRLS
jgi:hypothetical protein